MASALHSRGGVANTRWSNRSLGTVQQGAAATRDDERRQSFDDVVFVSFDVDSQREVDSQSSHHDFENMRYRPSVIGAMLASETGSDLSFEGPGPLPSPRLQETHSSESIMANVWERIASTGGELPTSQRMRSNQALTSRPDCKSSVTGAQDATVCDEQFVLPKAPWSCSLRMTFIIFASMLVLMSCVGLLVLQEILIAHGKSHQGDFSTLASYTRIVGISISILAVTLSIVLGATLGRSISTPVCDITAQIDGLGKSLEFEDLFWLHQTKKRCVFNELGDLQERMGRLLTSVSAFCAYMPNTVVRAILAGDPRAMRLHVSRRKVAILFSDIVEFTSMSESVHQEDLLFMLTWYLSTMTRIVEANGGVVAEILGDGLLCFWNTPDEIPDYLSKSLSAALAMQAVIRHMNSKLIDMELPQLKIRVGVHTGNVLTGNIGSEAKMKFGCLGDPVNVASRLEGLCKFYGVGIVVSSSVVHGLAMNTPFFFRRLDLVQLKGKSSPCSVYELLGITSELSTSNSSLSSLLDTANAAMTATQSALRSTTSSQPSWDRKLDDPPSLVMSRAITLETGDSKGSAEFAVGANPLKDKPSLVNKEARRRTELYEMALTHFQKVDFAAAKSTLERILHEWPDDRASVILLDRVRPLVRPDGSPTLSKEELSKFSAVRIMSNK